MIAFPKSSGLRVRHERRVEAARRDLTDREAADTKTMSPRDAADQALGKARRLLSQLLSLDGNSASRHNDGKLNRELGDLEERVTPDVGHGTLLIVAEEARRLANRIEALLLQGIPD